MLKSLYGLRHAPRLWYEMLARCLASIGFQPFSSSECMFRLITEDKVVILLAYVDDLLLFGEEKVVIAVKQKLKKIFSMEDLGTCCFYLGVKINHTTDGLFLGQPSFIEKIIRDAHMVNAKPTKTPLPFGHVIYDERVELTDQESIEMENVPYRSVFGSLLFLATRTRPDIAAAVSMLGRFLENPAPKHWKAMKHLVRYLIGTKYYGLRFKKSTEPFTKFEGWSDADWARDKTTRRSRSGIVLMVDENPIMWTSKLQTATALSTSEAEFSALADTVREISWLRAVLNDIGLELPKPTTIFQDNLGTISWTEEVQGLRKAKHIGIKYHYVKESVQNGKIEVQYIPSEKTEQTH